MRSLLLLAAATILAATGSDSYQKWRADYEAGLKAPEGWLSVAGLYWLHDGPNSVPLSGGGQATFQLESGKVRYEGRVLKPDADTVKVADVSLSPIERGGKIGIRVRDPHAETRRDFTG